jgi:hypothetical protein
VCSWGKGRSVGSKERKWKKALKNDSYPFKETSPNSVYSYGKWFHKLLGRIISLDFNDLKNYSKFLPEP